MRGLHLYELVYIRKCMMNGFNRQGRERRGTERNGEEGILSPRSAQRARRGRFQSSGASECAKAMREHTSGAGAGRTLSEAANVTPTPAVADPVHDSPGTARPARVRGVDATRAERAIRIAASSTDPCWRSSLPGSGVAPSCPVVVVSSARAARSGVKKTRTQRRRRVFMRSSPRRGGTRAEWTEAPGNSLFPGASPAALVGTPGFTRAPAALPDPGRRGRRR